MDSYANLAGLKLNDEKSVNIWLGSKAKSETKWLPHLDICPNPDKIKILGIWFTNNLEHVENLNLNKNVMKFKT